MTSTLVEDHEPNRSDLVELGREAIRKGRLQRLREKLGLSANAMAELLHTSAITYISWEINPHTRVWPSTAQRVGAFYQAAMNELTLMGRSFNNNLIPFHVVATYCGLPHEVLLHWYRQGRFEAVDLGVLGLWVNRREIEDKLKRSVPTSDNNPLLGMRKMVKRDRPTAPGSVDRSAS
jgi:transcriptional regulator with XRE-family HTH domain